jgi:hypothetical protein
MKTVYIRKDHAKALKEYVNQRLSNSILLTEESGNVRKKVKEIIKASFPPQMEQQLNMSLNDPYMINNVKPQVCQGGAEPQIWNSVANHPQQNTFLDFLRANLYSQLGINHKRGPIEYIIGATRIMCQDLGFYSFNESQLKGGLIIKFCKLLNAIHDYKKFFIEDGHDMDINLDGMSYTEFMAKFEKKYSQWREAMFQTMNSEEPTANGGYKVVPIKDKFVGTGCMPIGKSLEFLLSLGEYTDWCICHEGTLRSMYPQYTGGGGKVYVLLRGDYKEVEMKEGTDCPLDDYGLSMICVIVGPDGMPDNVTTRWNHNNGGENPEGLRTALDVQRVTGIKYTEVFKPRTDRELDAMHMLGEDKVPSAMDQVDNKVNAGVMDAVTGGGMMEGAEPESDEYTIAGEGGNNENFHVNERKKSLMITEEQWKRLQLIIENEGTNLKKARNLLKKKGYSEEQRQEILNSIRNDIPNARLQQCKFMLGVTRMYLDGELMDADKIGKLNKTLEYIASDAHVNDYDYNLNGESCETLIDRFSEMAKSDLEASKANSAARQLTPNENYTIVPIDNPKEAAKYRRFTSWCVTHDASMYNSYTNNGLGRFYFCLRNDFQTARKVKGENCPLDDYGLSMIAVSVDMDGYANTITCRWNHDNGGDDKIMSVEQLEDIIGRNFYQTFLPYTKDELHARGIVLKEDVQGLLDSGKPLKEIFKAVSKTNKEDITLVVLQTEEYNFIKNGKILSKNWFTTPIASWEFNHGVIPVRIGDRMNGLTENGELILKDWVRYFWGFRDSAICAVGNYEHGFNEYNYIYLNGELVFKNWYIHISPLHTGGEIPNKFVVTFIDEDDGLKSKLINIDETPISDIIFDRLVHESEGLICVENISRKNYIDINTGELISKLWFSDADRFKEGLAAVSLEREDIRANGFMLGNVGNNNTRVYNYLKHDGTFLMDEWVHCCWDFSYGFGMVMELKPNSFTCRNYVDKNGNFLSKVWFDWCETFGSHDRQYGRARIGDYEIYIKNDGTYEALINGMLVPVDITPNGNIVRKRNRQMPQVSLSEARIGNFDFKKYFKPIAEFMKEDGLSVSPYPKVKLDWSEQDGLFIKTGYYEPESKTITIFCNDRHPKDILRTFCHEMIHHSQNLDGVDLSFSSNDDVKDNERLEEIESEAYLKGNVYFRKWTEYQNKSKDLLQENIENEKWNGDGEEMELDHAGDDINLPPFLYHVSPIKNRANIKALGLIPSVGEEYEKWWDFEGPNGEVDDSDLPELVFMTKEPETWLDCTGYKGFDLYKIDTSKLNKNELYFDPTPHLAEAGSYCYGETVPPSAIKLVKTFTDGTGDNDIIYEETKPEDIDLSSFDIKTALNPKFWKDGHLDSRIRMKLLDIADDFIEFIGIDWVKPDDVIMTGSLANYNWNKKFSDIDLHIVLDYSKVDKRADFVKNYFYSQKELWNENHKDLKIFGFPVEVYVQDKNEKHSSTGVYSLDKDKWITEPERKKLKAAKINKSYIKKKVAEFVDIIDELEKNYKNADGDYALRKVSEKADRTFDRIKSERKSGLGKSDNEISNGNIIYKCLRRLGYIDKIFDIKDDAYNKLNSLSEGRTLLKEDQEGDSMKKARRYLVQNHGFTEEKANEVVRINVRQAFSALHHNEKAGKFIFGLTRILFDENISSGTKGRLNTILKVITSSDELYNSFDKNLNGLSASELIAKFSKQIEQAIQKQKTDMENSKEKYSNNYRIVRIDSFEDAKKYSDLTDFGDTYGHWCLTYREDMYRSYTNDGRNQIYFCLKDGLENLEPVEGEGCPYDEFGLSMLSIIVSPAGGLLYCTTRWNHLHGGGDNMMNAQQIEELLGVDFNNTFLPAYDFERNAQKQIKDFYATGNIGVFDFVDALNSFGDGHFCIVRAGEIYNIVHGNKVLFDGWFDDAYYNDGDFGIVVYRNDKANIVLPSGKFLFRTWFDRIYHNSGVFTVEKNGYANLISTDGKLLSETWFDWIGGFNGNRTTPVQLNDKYNLISIEGKLLSDTWFDSLSDFKDGYSVARLDGKENYIDTNGKLLFREWVDDCRSVYNGIGIIATQCEDILGNSFTGYYAIDLENRKMITDKPYELLYTTYDKNVLIVGYTKKDFPDYIERDKYNLLKNGKTLLLKEWVDNIKGFNKGGDSIFCKVVKDDKRNYARMTDGSYVFDKWYDDITITTWSFRNDFVFNIAVKNGENTLWNVADENGKIMLPDWYNFVDAKIVNEQITVIVSTATEEGGITNVVRDGKFILPFWVISIDHLYSRGIAFTAERKFWAQVYTYFPENDTVVRGQYNAPNENCLYGACSAAQFAEKFKLPMVQTY